MEFAKSLLKYYENDLLVGGLYGIDLGSVFCVGKVVSEYQ